MPARFSQAIKAAETRQKVHREHHGPESEEESDSVPPDFISKLALKRAAEKRPPRVGSVLPAHSSLASTQSEAAIQFLDVPKTDASVDKVVWFDDLSGCATASSSSGARTRTRLPVKAYFIHCNRLLSGRFGRKLASHIGKKKSELR